MKASVLMSIYNETAEQIKESVSSVLSQDFKEYELIIVLDNPDRTDVEAVLDCFGDPRIVFLRNDRNIGLAMCVNRAASIAKSEIFIRMDADDISLPGRFKREMDIIESGDYDFVYSNYNDIGTDSHIIRQCNVEEDITDPQVTGKLVSLDPSIIHHPTVMFTKQIFEKAGRYRDFPCSQDSDLWLRMAENGCRFYKLGTPYLNYRVNPNSVTSKRWYQQQLTCHYIFELSLQRLTQGKDDYSLKDYHKYLDKFKVNDENEKSKLKKAVDTLFQAAMVTSQGHRVKGLFLRAKVLLISNVYRRHYYNLIRKRLLLGK